MHQACTLMPCLVQSRLGNALGGYNLAQTSQYHIQTDEGPERYFRYQTDSGQYRKEKRLEDGTVVGTYGWVDAAGFLRLRDYVADNNGYRIVRTKKLWVGDEPIGRAVASAKYAPSTGGVGVIESSTPRPFNVFQSPSPYPDTVYVTPPSPYRVSTSGYLPPVSTPSYLPPVSSTPAVYLPPVSSTPRPYISSTTSKPYYPAVSTSRPYYPSSTPRPYSSSTSAPFVSVSSTPSPSYPSSSVSSSLPEVTPSPIRVDDASAYSSPSSPLYSGRSRPHPFHRGSTVYSSTSGLYDHAPRRGYISEVYDGSSNSISPDYDGVSVTRNGFRYYLPRQYQEEDSNSSGDRRTGSFGYIDPFGIRRVIYYNSSPGQGFQVRKNNRYVGFNATPYDPRP